MQAENSFIKNVPPFIILPFWTHKNCYILTSEKIILPTVPNLGMPQITADDMFCFSPEFLLLKMTPTIPAQGWTALRDGKFALPCSCYSMVLTRMRMLQGRRC